MKKTHKINGEFLYQLDQARRDETAASASEALANQSKLNLERAKLRLYPEAGILTRKGKTVFYAHTGPARQYVESADLDTVTRAIDGGKPRIVPLAS